MTADTQAPDLVALPMPALYGSGDVKHLFTSDQMREYGRACAAAALQGRGTPCDPQSLLMRNALMAIKYDAVSLADAQVLALRALNGFGPEGRAQEGEPSDERAAFEAHIQATEERKPLLWSTAFKNSVSGEQVPAYLVGKYFMQADQKAWTAWQARAALAQAQKERT